MIVRPIDAARRIQIDLSLIPSIKIAIKSPSIIKHAGEDLSLHYFGSKR